MATIRKRGDKWQVQVRRKGSPPQSRTFNLKSDAQAWARQSELAIDRYGLVANHRSLSRITVAEIIERYRDEIVPGKRSHAFETIILNAFLRHKLAHILLSELMPAHIAAYRDERLKTVKPSTLNRQLGILRNAFTVAEREWQIPLSQNPFAQIARPKSGSGRSRRLQVAEWERIHASLPLTRNRLIATLIDFALETAMRRGEILNCRWRDVNIAARTLHIPVTKNGAARTIPLTRRAISILEALQSDGKDADARIIPITAYSIRMAWDRLMRRADIRDFHFHDLRHEAVSRFFERGLSMPEVALISGHKDPRMLFRYTHPRAEDVVHKLT